MRPLNRRLPQELFFNSSQRVKRRTKINILFYSISIQHEKNLHGIFINVTYVFTSVD